MSIQTTFYSKLRSDKIKINWNKNPIPVDKFLSFLTIETEIIRDHLGANTGWTRRENEEHNLIVGGGIVNGVNWLDTIQYGNHLQNKYNNYVNPFYLKDIMKPEGILFFLDYYMPEIEKLKNGLTTSRSFHQKAIADLTSDIEDIEKEIESLKTGISTLK